MSTFTNALARPCLAPSNVHLPIRSEILVSNQHTVRGERFTQVASRSTSDLGSKFWGKYVFTLRRNSDGELFTVYGKRVAANSRLTPVSK